MIVIEVARWQRGDGTKLIGVIWCLLLQIGGLNSCMFPRLPALWPWNGGSARGWSNGAPGLLINCWSAQWCLLQLCRARLSGANGSYPLTTMAWVMFAGFRCRGDGGSTQARSGPVREQTERGSVCTVLQQPLQHLCSTHNVEEAMGGGFSCSLKMGMGHTVGAAFVWDVRR